MTARTLTECRAIVCDKVKRLGGYKVPIKYRADLLLVIEEYAAATQTAARQHIVREIGRMFL